MPLKTLVAANKLLHRKDHAKASIIGVLGHSPRWMYENDLRAASGVNGSLFRKAMGELEQQGTVRGEREPAGVFLFNLARPEDGRRQWLPRNRYRLNKKRGRR